MAKIKLKDLVKQVSANNAPSYEWSQKDQAAADKPEPGKTYALTGSRGSRCIANGYSWKDSEVKLAPVARTEE